MRTDANDLSKWTLPKYLALKDYLRHTAKKPTYKHLLKTLEFDKSELYKRYKTIRDADLRGNLFEDNYAQKRDKYNNDNGFPVAESKQDDANLTRADSAKGRLLIRLSL